MTTFSNFPTMLQTNKSSSSTTIQDGNLYMPGVSYDSNAIGSVGVSSGKWYVEFKFISGYETADGTVHFGICTQGGHRASNNDGLYYENSVNLTIGSRQDFITYPKQKNTMK